MKRAAGFDPEQHFVISDEVKDLFKDSKTRGEKVLRDWEDLIHRYSEAHPPLAAEFEARCPGQLPSTWAIPYPNHVPEKATATRASSGLVFNPITEKLKSLMVGTADLSPSVNMISKGKEDFQHLSLRTQCCINGS